MSDENNLFPDNGEEDETSRREECSNRDSERGDQAKHRNSFIEPHCSQEVHLRLLEKEGEQICSVKCSLDSSTYLSAWVNDQEPSCREVDEMTECIRNNPDSLSLATYRHDRNSPMFPDCFSNEIPKSITEDQDSKEENNASKVQNKDLVSFPFCPTYEVPQLIIEVKDSEEEYNPVTIPECVDTETKDQAVLPMSSSEPHCSQNIYADNLGKDDVQKTRNEYLLKLSTFFSVWLNNQEPSFREKVGEMTECIRNNLGFHSLASNQHYQNTPALPFCPYEVPELIIEAKDSGEEYSPMNDLDKGLFAPGPSHATDEVSYKGESRYWIREPASSIACSREEIQVLSVPPSVDPVQNLQPTMHETARNRLTLFDDAIAFSGPSRLVCDEGEDVFKDKYKFLNHSCKLTREESNQVLKQTGSVKNKPKHFKITKASKKPKTYRKGAEKQGQESDDIHERIHENERSLCDVCGRSFSSVNNLFKHKILCTALSKGKEYTCDICNKTFKYKITVIRHHWMHTQESTLKCKNCGNSFSSEYQLNRHEKSCKSKDKKFSCEKCHRKYGCKTDLEIHYRKHTGERPYECDKCGKGFCTSGSLSRHKRSCGCSKDDRPYACDKCNKKFTRKDYLFNHSLIHSGVKRYQCEKCGFSYFTKEGLNMHKISRVCYF